MKKIMLTILLCGSILLTITGCKEKKQIDEETLKDVNDKIVEYFLTHDVKDYDNYCFNYIDEKNNVVVVGLENNSKEEQEKFKKTVVNSKLIKFIKGNKVQEENKLSLEELKILQEEITTKVSNQKNYNNFASCGIDEKNLVLIVELVDNSKEKQDWFKENISDSPSIFFIQGGPYTTS